LESSFTQHLLPGHLALKLRLGQAPNPHRFQPAALLPGLVPLAALGTLLAAELLPGLLSAAVLGIPPRAAGQL